MDFGQLIGHHIIELTEDNINNPDISLNPNNIEIICHKCHNLEHARFGGKQQVYIVYGSPLSGKTSLVKELMRHGDIVLDLDEIWQAITYQTGCVKPDNVRFNIFKLRDELLDQIKMRYGNWYTAYVIGGYPEKYERERIAQELGAELIYCESTLGECLTRVEPAGRPARWVDYINEWWDKYTI
ncbi:HNH endonuclease [Clostridia bacterium]|nr:HNH endonuclease [Clostridia bacterium]